MMMYLGADRNISAGGLDIIAVKSGSSLGESHSAFRFDPVVLLHRAGKEAAAGPLFSQV